MTKKLRTGFTTGTAAAAATKGALLMILEKKAPSQVSITLLTGDTLKLKIHSCKLDDAAKATCTVIKDAGDDPDVTHNAEIGAKVRLIRSDDRLNRESKAKVLITGGEGVGRVTKPGLEVLPGDPAINPGPRKMITQAVDDVLHEHALQHPVQVEIFVLQGKKLAEKTLNARLGILNGLSILGTTGIVRPMSHDAFTATIKSALSIAQASGLDHVILTTGRRSERFAQTYWSQLPEEAFIQIGDFFKMSLQFASEKRLMNISLAVFFGKAIKMAQGMAHTHAAKASLRLDKLSEWAEKVTRDRAFSQHIRTANTARHAFEIIQKKYPEVIFYVGKQIIKSAKSFSHSKANFRSVIFDYTGAVVFDSAKS
ncbi:MAG: cobalt-precorrin-5B (C(1))-methyltransferase [Desulfobacterales bacterium]|nr:MAG: cobalt-precorrin-5B (C(1))-methyltransferase [Desulfobacterales bacterium]